MRVPHETVSEAPLISADIGGEVLVFDLRNKDSARAPEPERQLAKEALADWAEYVISAACSFVWNP